MRWLPPGRDVDVFRKRLFRFRPTLYAMVGEGYVAAVFGVALWHMASDTVAVGGRMRLGKPRCVATQAFRSIERCWLNRVSMRIMASTAPQPSIAIARTHTQGKLLDVADHPELCSGPRRHAIAVNGVRIFQWSSGMKIAGLLTRIKNLGDSQQVALLAYAVPRSTLQLAGFTMVSISRIRRCTAVAPWHRLHPMERCGTRRC